MYSTKISEVLKLLIVLLHRQAESRGIGVIGAVNVIFFFVVLIVDICCYCLQWIVLEKTNIIILYIVLKIFLMTMCYVLGQKDCQYCLMPFLYLKLVA